MSEDITQQRHAAYNDLIFYTRSLLDTRSVDRGMLEDIRIKLDTLAAETSLWTNEDYAAPEEGEQQNRFRIGGEDNNGITLYLNVMRPGKKINPHNHTTWACISAVSGIEHNTLYSRTDDGSVPGASTIEKQETIALAPGNSLAMLADDIHSVDIRGDEIIRHLHLYGQPLESLTGRKMYNMAAGTYAVMDIGVKTKG